MLPSHPFSGQGRLQGGCGGPFGRSGPWCWGAEVEVYLPGPAFGPQRALLVAGLSVYVKGGSHGDSLVLFGSFLPGSPLWPA